MLSSSRAKIHNPAVIGVSPRPTDRRQRQKTAKHEGQTLAPDNQAYNTLHRATRCLGERRFALLTGRWRALQRITISPSRIGELAQAALVLTRLENGQLRTSC